MINVAFVRGKKRAVGGTLPFGRDRISEIEKGGPLHNLVSLFGMRFCKALKQRKV
jgi:hypothetical protein